MQSFDVSEHFSIDERGEIATCDYCKEKFDLVDGYMQFEDHFVSCLERLRT